MGNARSTFFEPVCVDLWWNNEQVDRSETEPIQRKQSESTNARAAGIMEAQSEISTIHEKRIKLIAEKKKEFDDLRQELARQKKENEELKQILQQGNSSGNQVWDTSKVDISLQTDTFEVPGQDSHDLKAKVEELQTELNHADDIKHKNRDLQINIAKLQKDLQDVNVELAAFESERQEYKTHVNALKDIITVSKQLLLMREGQVKTLNQKIEEIQASLAEKELTALSDDLRAEYERQLRNIRQLRALYEERQQAGRSEIDSLKNQLEEAKTALKSQEAQNSELQERVDELEKDTMDKSGTIMGLESQLGLSKAECRELRAEMNVINQLFSQTLLGFNNGQEIDLDKLIKTLEENHDLLTDIVINEECTELSSSLPKVLLNLVDQVNQKSATPAQENTNSNTATTLSTITEESDSQTQTPQNSLSSASEIVQNLPKVWRVLTELLSHQTGPASVLNDNPEQSDNNPCYKSVQTPSGSTLVLSVSKTFIRLKNLILEKKSLEKETTRLKQLNSHLETRLQDQEKRLETVSHELSKTWNVVGKMQKQHQQLHTQEKILRYELAQKRKLLNELKEELEYCREKWLQAREKNSTTEEQWRQLRTEFAARKNTISEDLNNSGESGYSDERESSSDDEPAEFESEISVPSPETVPGCSSVSENFDVVDELQEDTASVETVTNVDDTQVEPNEILENNSEHSEEILKVIQDEISHIENSVGEAATSQQIESDNQCVLSADGNISESCDNLQQQNSAESSVQERETPTEDNTTNSSTTIDSTVVENSEHCSMEIPSTSSSRVQVKKILKTDLVQSRGQVQANEHSASSSNRNTETSTKTRRQDIDDMYKRLEEDILQTIRKTQSGEDYPSTSKQTRTVEEILAASEERLRRREEQEAQLIGQPSKTKLKNSENTKNQTVSEPVVDTTFTQLLAEAVEAIEKVQNTDQGPSTSKQDEPSMTSEEILAAREERLKTLEAESNELVSKDAKTSSRSHEISSKLDELHEQYGEHRTQSQSLEKTDTSPGESHVELDEASTSSSRNHQELLARREERLQRMEQEARELMGKALRNSFRGITFCRKLNKLHDRYGTSSDSDEGVDASDDNNNDTANDVSEEHNDGENENQETTSEEMPNEEDSRQESQQ